MSDDLRVGGVVVAGVDGWLVDPGFLVKADPAEVLGLLDAASGPAARLAAAVYRESAHLHRDADAGVRRQLLALDAARYGDLELSARITAVSVKGEPAAQWGVQWATGSVVDHRFRRPLTGHTRFVRAVATAMVDGRPVAVTSSKDATVRVWDLATGRQVGEPLTGHARSVLGVATAVVDGRPVAVTGSKDATVRVWDLATGRQVGGPLTGHTSGVRAVATAVLDGRPVAVTGSKDATVRVWDLATGRQVGEPLTGHTSGVRAVATAVVDGRPVAVTGSWDGEVRMWSLATGEWVGKPLTGHSREVAGVATAVLDGRRVAVPRSSDDTVRVWDLATGEQVRDPLTGHRYGVSAVTTAVVEGRAVAVTVDWDGVVRAWNLTSDEHAPLTGHTDVAFTTNVRLGMVTAVVEGYPVAVTSRSEEDGEEVRVWDLATGEQVGGGPTDNTAAMVTVVAGPPVGVTGGRDGAVQLWDLVTAEQVGEPLTGHTEGVAGVATAVVDDRQAAATAASRPPSCQTKGSTVRVGDLATGRQLGEPLICHAGAVRAVATAVMDGRPVAVTGSEDKTVRVWDLATGRQVGRELVFPAPVHAVAVTPDGRLVIGFGWEVAVLARP
jgi:WD40 repeat protein